jgi:ribosomal protein S18 acetylase RimI-like enzyme
MEAIDKRLVYVAKLQNTVVGYVTLSIQEKSGPGTVSKRLLRLDSICVDKALRGHGIGKAMVTDVRALARVFRCTELILGVHPENDEAIAFYQKCGFRIRTINMDAVL